MQTQTHTQQTVRDFNLKELVGKKVVLSVRNSLSGGAYVEGFLFSYDEGLGSVTMMSNVKIYGTVKVTLNFTIKEEDIVTATLASSLPISMKNRVVWYTSTDD